MLAAVAHSGGIVVKDIEDPRPPPGSALLRVLACGICGSDIHFLAHGADWARYGGIGTLGQVDVTRDVVMGHEFCGEVVALGAETRGPPPGTIVTSMPVVIDDDGTLRGIGYDNDFPGGFGQLIVVAAPFLVRVPNGLSAHHAALTEPMAVGVHAVARSGAREGEAALVLGCGAVGLAVVAALRLAGVAPIVAADFSATRRQLAVTMGAHEMVDPRAERGIDAWRRIDGKLPLIVFEVVGVPGMIQSAIDDAPRDGRIVVVGVCMTEDRIHPMVGIAKELTVQFALGYRRAEFSQTLRAIAEGQIDVAPLITGTVGLDGVAGAFDALRDPEAHCKILVDPLRSSDPGP